MSNDPEEAFVDGLTEDLITDLSSELFVIASNSAFAYKGRHMDVRRIARVAISLKGVHGEQWDGCASTPN